MNQVNELFEEEISTIEAKQPLEGVEGEPFHQDDEPKQSWRSNQHSNRRQSHQQCASLWAQSQANLAFRDQFKQFDHGSAKYKSALVPSIADVVNFVSKRHKNKEPET